MRSTCTALLLATLVVALACDESPNSPIDESGYALVPSYAKEVASPTASWRIPLADNGLGLVSDGAFGDGTYSVYDNGVCSVTTKIFTAGSGDATLQTNNPVGKTKGCGGRAMTVRYPVGDPVYPNGGSETMPVFLTLHNISNSTTTISIGYANRVERQLSLNPTQNERCDAWRWSSVQVPGDYVWVERISSTTYHVYTKDRDPDPVLAAANAANNRAVCTTTGQSHHLSVDLYIVANQALPTSSLNILPALPLVEHSTSAPFHSVTGGGQIDLSGFDPDLAAETYAFSASVDADGHVRGNAQIDLSDPHVTFHADVTCLAVEGTSAWIGGVVTETSDATIVAENTPLWLRVQDNGQGGSSNPDVISFLRIGAPASVCSQKRPAGMPFAFFHGNLQVR